MERTRRKELEAKVVAGTLSLQEMQEVIADLREGRVSAGYASKGAKTKKATAKAKKQQEMDDKTIDIFEQLEKEGKENDGEDML